MLELLDEIRSETRGRPDAAIAALAERQHGVVARRQLAALPLGPGAIQHRLNSGRLHPVFRGVFAVGHCSLTARGKWMAAVLAGGRRALLSHRSATSLWDLASYAGTSIQVTVPRTCRSPRAGLVVHGADLGDDDYSICHGIPVTSVARTLLDIAALLDQAGLERATANAERLELFDLRAVRRLCARCRGRRGVARLRTALELVDEVPATRSELERELVALCRMANLPAPAVNGIVEGLEVDAHWEFRRLVVELDGYAFHKGRAAFERDRARDAALMLAGFRVLRITARRLREEPEAVSAAIRRLLSTPPSRA